MQKLESVAGSFSKIRIEKINLNSHPQVKEYLLSQGWKPTTWNRVRDANGEWKTTSPKLTEDSFASIKGELGQLLALRNVLMHRRRFISNERSPTERGAKAYIRDDGRVPAAGILCATPTGRSKHRGAICNVPKAKKSVLYGTELRSLFYVPRDQGYLMLGADLDQIEARITAHYATYFDAGKYWKILLEVDDIHSYNAKLIKSDRDTAKNFQYALFYGAQAPKLSSIIGCTVREAERHIKAFWEGNKGVHDLVQNLEYHYDKNKFIVGLDGRKLFIRAKYKLLNSLIQSGAAIIWKKWGCLANERLREAGIDCKQIIAYHDEYEYRCEEVAVPLATEIIKTAAVDAGKHFKLHVPISADVKVGNNWAEVH